MVFGWGKKKTKKGEPERFKPQEKQISFSEIKALTEQIEAMRTKTIVAEAKSFQNKIERELQLIHKIIRELEKADLKTDDIDKHLQILVVKVKKTVISTVKKETTTKLPDIKSYQDVVTLNTISAQSLKRIGDVLGRQSRIIHIFAKKYAAKLKEHLAILNSDRQELQNLIDNYETIQNTINDIFSQIERYDEAKKTIVDLNQRITQLKDSIEKYNLEIDSTKEEISKLKSSEVYTKNLEIQKKLESLSTQKNQIKNQIDLQFTKISRPLSKYEYVSALDKPQKVLMEKLILNPFYVLTPENKQNIIKILSAVRKGVEGGSVSVKDITKSLRQIDETIEALEGLINQVKEFSNRKKNYEDDLSNFNIDELKLKEDYLTKTTENKTDAESKIRKLQSEISESEKTIPQSVMEIEIMLKKISGTKYRIKN